jgi:hypothetical protein
MEGRAREGAQPIVGRLAREGSGVGARVGTKVEAAGVGVTPTKTKRRERITITRGGELVDGPLGAQRRIVGGSV